MAVELKAPHFPESVEDGTLMTWHKQEGDAVARDEKVADIETDKVVLEVAAPEDGVLTRILKKEGEVVQNDEVLAMISSGGEAPPTATEARAEPAPAAEADKTREPVMSPAVRKLVQERGLDPSDIPATGKGGRLTKADVRGYAEEAPEPPTEVAPAKPAPSPATSAAILTDAGGRPQERVPMNRLRARIAQRLVQVQQETAMLTTFNEVNMQPIMELRKRFKERFEAEHGVKLGFMSFFVKASVEALKQFPAVNASVDGSDIVYHGFYDVGIAVSTERGLMVPVLRDADLLSFAQIESSIETYAGRARDGAITLEELSGGTFTITNGGVFGSLLSTPILNPPQSAILGMHKIQERPVAEEGQVVVRPIMYLALSYDHRIVDGKEAVQFLVAIKEILEEPSRLLLQV